MNREFSKSEFWLCPAGRGWIKSDKMARIGAKHERQRTRSDNGSVQRVAGEDLQANGNADHRHSVATVGYPKHGVYGRGSENLRTKYSCDVSAL